MINRIQENDLQKEFGLDLSSKGKVRDIYESKDKKYLLIYTTDRISAFDFVFNDMIPGKGVLLNKLSLFWFNLTKEIIRNHIVDPNKLGIKNFPSDYEERCMFVQKVKVLPIEAIVRGYLAGSAWELYKKKEIINEEKSNIKFKKHERFKNPIFTPSTKAEIGEKDKNISFEEMKNLIGGELAEKIKNISINLYNFAYSFAIKKGIVIADTKFEFGLDDDDNLILIDEIFTPDCSRFWMYDTKKETINYDSFDKQFLRDYLIDIKWNNKQINLPEEIKSELMKRYQLAYDLLTR
ncbi:MAG: phosphoribosylaminoimidazolesuccinocarboxamide synthase [Pseudomonadota bacterium]|nr:phosphoribosylaminoimidazolesuccinocarboxamide synthase [Pseudomonadota bacterium]